MTVPRRLAPSVASGSPEHKGEAGGSRGRPGVACGGRCIGGRVSTRENWLPGAAQRFGNTKTFGVLRGEFSVLRPSGPPAARPVRRGGDLPGMGAYYSNMPFLLGEGQAVQYSLKPVPPARTKSRPAHGGLPAGRHGRGPWRRGNGASTSWFRHCRAQAAGKFQPRTAADVLGARPPSSGHEPGRARRADRCRAIPRVTRLLLRRTPECVSGDPGSHSIQATTGINLRD
jgi:hypothetical protein